MQIYFKNWLENQVLGGGLTPPDIPPFDPEPAPGQTDALQRYHSFGSDELPPDKENKRLRRKMMKKLKG